MILRIFVHTFAIVSGLFILSIAAAVPAAADLRFCNQTKSRVGVAIGYRDKQGWATEGWFNLEPGACETILRGPLIAKYYYFHAVDYDQGGFWGGKSMMCTQEKVFTIRDIGNCSERGFESTGFAEIDIGKYGKWTIKLTEAGDNGGPDQ